MSSASSLSTIEQPLAPLEEAHDALGDNHSDEVCKISTWQGLTLRCGRPAHHGYGGTQHHDPPKEAQDPREPDSPYQ